MVAKLPSASWIQLNSSKSESMLERTNILSTPWDCRRIRIAVQAPKATLFVSSEWILGRPILKPQLLEAHSTTNFLLNSHLGNVEENVNLFGWLGLSPMSGSDLKSNQGGKELAAAVDIVDILMTHKNQ